MTVDAEDRHRRAQRILWVLGALANVIGVIQFAGSHLHVLLVGVLVLWVLLWIYGRGLWGFLSRHRRDLLFLVLGAVLSAAGIEGHRLWKPEAPPPNVETRPSPPAPSPPVVTATPTPEPAVPSEIVYRTSSGKRYHRADCSFVKGKAIAISLKGAKEAGLTPCKVCRPPSLP